MALSSYSKRSHRPDQRWLDLGLRSAYLLTQDLWRVNLVDGSIGGTSVGTDPMSFPGGLLRTAGAVGRGAYLSHGLTTGIALPISIVVGCRRISGVVTWSLLRTDISQWTGWYGGTTGAVNSTDLNDFSVAVVLGSANVAVAHRSGSEFVGFGAGGGNVVDTTATAPAGVSTTVVTLGWARRSVGDAAAVAEFSHFYAFQGSLDDGALVELAKAPERLFSPKRIWVPRAAITGLPTLSASTYKPGTLTSSGWTPRITAS